METSKSRIVLVTGSSRGIGQAIAAAFAAHGDMVILNGREDAAKLNQSVEELRQAGYKAAGYLADLSDYATAQDMYKRIENEYGPVDVLVNNAGAAYYGLFSDMEIAVVRGVLDQNLATTINASHLAVPAMVRAKCGCIINITSVWGVAGASCEVIYSAAKAGVIGFTKALAKELGPSSVRVNAIACGAFDTRMNDNLSPEEKAAFAENIPLGRFGHPKEVGALAVYMAGAEYMTGQVVALDGGVL
ncbi:MAG: SDR family NAD(P)-dependent oxidoreductase [Defluviitaleaceae bacterium]|nr:SDR family NAD(P)-dependent oxidoreductase [Defluviitaleaceae bacterium]